MLLFAVTMSEMGVRIAGSFANDEGSQIDTKYNRFTHRVSV